MKRTIRAIAICIVAAALAAGCASTLPDGKPVYVYVASNGIVSFRGETMKSSELPERLLKAGAVPTTHIMLVAQGEVPSQHLKEMALDCGRAGLPNCTIRESRKITIETSNGKRK